MKASIASALIVAAANAATFGFDISQPISTSTAQCLKGYGYDWIAPRAWTSTGHHDSAACTSLISAKNAGIKQRDVYMFPCPTCSASARTQIDDMITYLDDNCGAEWSGMIWLDIEGSQYWLGNSSANRTWYQDLVSACKGRFGIKCGVYASYYQWESIFGTVGYCYGSDLPLWYAHYDNVANFSDYNEFGCWKTPSVKQYEGDVTLCSFNIDKDYVN